MTAADSDADPAVDSDPDASARRRILMLNGPNLNLLGTREPEIYGTATLDDIMTALRRTFSEQAELLPVQSNSEGALVDALHDARDSADGVIFNPGAFTHYSIALRDAVAACGLPVVETHLSNVYAREPFRRQSVISEVCLGVVAGFGYYSYFTALEALLGWLDDRSA